MGANGHIHGCNSHDAYMCQLVGGGTCSCTVLLKHDRQSREDYMKLPWHQITQRITFPVICVSLQSFLLIYLISPLTFHALSFNAFFPSLVSFCAFLHYKYPESAVFALYMQTFLNFLVVKCLILWELLQKMNNVSKQSRYFIFQIRL